MRTRCENPNYIERHLYSERGITVCERWKKFENFLEDMGRRPSLRHSLDRIDNEQGYSPENCRWATAAEQGRNKRTSRRINYKGRILCLVDWAAVCGVRPSTLHERLARYGDQKGLSLYEPFKGDAKTGASWDDAK